MAAAGGVVGPRVGRRLATVVLRLRAWTPAGWLEGVQPVATRPAPGAPALTRLPEGWWTASPLVQVREYLDRLGYESTGRVLPVANEVYRPRA